MHFLHFIIFLGKCSSPDPNANLELACFLPICFSFYSPIPFSWIPSLLSHPHRPFSLEPLACAVLPSIRYDLQTVLFSFLIQKLEPPFLLGNQEKLRIPSLQRQASVRNERFSVLAVAVILCVYAVSSARTAFLHIFTSSLHFFSRVFLDITFSEVLLWPSHQIHPLSSLQELFNLCLCFIYC